MSECLFPQLAPTTGYRQGCACDRCREAKRQYDREYRSLNRRASSNATRRNKQRYREITAAQATVSGPWSETEAQIALNWDSSLVHLAFYLKRTYKSVEQKRNQLLQESRLAGVY